MRPIQVSHAPESEGSLRAPERVKGYPVGRYIEPDDSKVMHERHTVYRVEQDADWNLRPAEEYDLPLGPSIAVSDPATVNNPYAADLENQLFNQKAYNASISQQNDAMYKEIENLKAAQQSDAEKYNKENTDLKKELQDTRLQINELKARLNGTSNSTLTSPVSAPLQLDEKKDWLPFLGTIITPEFLLQCIGLNLDFLTTWNSSGPPVEASPDHTSTQPMKNTNTVTIEIDAQVFATIKEAALIVNNAGISVPAPRVITALVNAELGSKTPQQLAGTFMKTVMNIFRDQRSRSPEEELDEDEIPLPKLPTRA